MKNKKILYISSNLNSFGGIQLYNRQFVNALKRVSSNIDLLELKRPSFLYKVNLTFKIIYKLFFNNYNLVICSHIGFAPLCYCLSIVFKFKYIIFFYGIDVKSKKNFIEDLSIKRAFGYVLIFNWAKSEFLSQYPEYENKIYIIPSPVDGNLFKIRTKPQELVEKYNIKNKKIILTVSRLSFFDKDRKGHEKVIRILPDIIKEHRNICYLIVGEGDRLAYLKDLVLQNNLTEYVIFAGGVSSDLLPHYFNLADFFILPSSEEGFGIVFMEALVSGCPVIAGDLSKSELLDGELGISVDPRNLDEIKNALIEFIDAMPEKYSDKHRLREIALKQYSLDNFSQKVEKFLMELV